MTFRSTRWLMLTIVLALVLGAPLIGRPIWDTAAQADVGLSFAEGDDANLLENPSFEDGFYYSIDPHTGIIATELEVGEGWTLWYDNVQECPEYDPDCPNPASYNRRPEYKREEGTPRVYAGAKAQKFFTTYGTHTAGFYQAVEVPADSWLRFSIWVWAWSSDKDIAEHSFQPGYYALEVGIDPTGGEAWDSDDIEWSEPIVRHDEWVQLTVDAHAITDTITVWTRGTQTWPVKHNDSYWDEAELVLLETPPEPTATPGPTHTPYPTPGITPGGYEPPECPHWQMAWSDDFAALTEDWGMDAAEGSVAIESGALWARNGSGSADAFPITWSEHAWPAEGDVRLSFRFAFENHTAYGSTIGVGSECYDGDRTLAPFDPYGIEDIVRIHHQVISPSAGEYSVSLLGQPVWEGVLGDTAWHTLELELRQSTYTLSMDGIERGSAVSHWRPQSLYFGNPVIVWQQGRWTEVGIDDVVFERCSDAYWMSLPLVVNRYQAGVAPTPTATQPPTLMAPTPTHTPDGPPTIPSRGGARPSSRDKK